MKITEIAEFLGGKIVGNSETNILRVASLENAQPDEISFVEKAESFAGTDASCLLVPENFDAELPGSFIKVKNPKLAFAKIAEILYQPHKLTGIHPTAQVASSAKIGTDVFVGAFSIIGENAEIGDDSQIFENVNITENVKIGNNCIIFPNVVIYKNVSLGNNVKLHAGVVIGADGFGFVRDGERGYVKFPQIGTVVIEDNVEIGANSCIDRGALGETRIGEGTKIDNLVQIAHNVQHRQTCRHRRANRHFRQHDHRRRLRNRRTSRNGRPRNCENRRDHRLTSRSFARKNCPRRCLVGNARAAARRI